MFGTCNIDFSVAAICVPNSDLSIHLSCRKLLPERAWTPARASSKLLTPAQPVAGETGSTADLMSQRQPSPREGWRLAGSIFQLPLPLVSMRLRCTISAEFPSKTELQGPTVVMAEGCPFYPFLPFPVSFPRSFCQCFLWQSRPHKPRAFKSSSLGLLLGEPRARH